MIEGVDHLVNTVMNIILVLLLIAIGFSLVMAHRSNGSSKYNKFNLIDLFVTKEGIVDGPRTMELIAFLVMTWGFVTLINQKSLSEWYVGIYIAAFVLRAAHSAYLKTKVGGGPTSGDPRP